MAKATSRAGFGARENAMEPGCMQLQTQAAVGGELHLRVVPNQGFVSCSPKCNQRNMRSTHIKTCNTQNPKIEQPLSWHYLEQCMYVYIYIYIYIYIGTSARINKDLGYRIMPELYRDSQRLSSLVITYSLHCSSLFWFNQYYIKDPKR